MHDNARCSETRSYYCHFYHVGLFQDPGKDQGRGTSGLSPYIELMVVLDPNPNSQCVSLSTGSRAIEEETL